MHQLQLSWVRSQHPSAQWNRRGGRWSSVEYSRKKNPPQKYLNKNISDSLVTLWWVKYTYRCFKFLFTDPDLDSFRPWVRDPGWKNSDPGQTSRICNNGSYIQRFKGQTEAGSISQQNTPLKKISKKIPLKSLTFFVYILQKEMKTSYNMQPNTLTRRGYQANIYIKNNRKI